jgi:hypothetical protein
LKAPTIKDLPLNKEMDSKDMTATKGGFSFPAVLNNVAPVKLIAPPVSVTPVGGVLGGDGGSGSGYDTGNGPVSYGNDPGGGGGYIGDSNYPHRPD